MQVLKPFQRTTSRKNINTSQNPQSKASEHLHDKYMSRKNDPVADQDIHIIGVTSQWQSIFNYVSQIYNEVFNQEDGNTDDEVLNEQLLKQMAERIKQQIRRLKQKEMEYIQLYNKLQNPSKKMGNEQKWKVIVLAYRQKITKLQTRLKQQRQSNALLQETIQLEVEQKERLAQLNNIKHRKINNLVDDLDVKEGELQELNNTINQLQNNLSQMKENNSFLQIKMEELVRANMNLSNQLQTQRQKTIYMAHQREQIVNKFKILGDEQQEINKEIRDLKAKYQIQITQLQNRIANLTIENQQALLLIQELQQNQIRNSQQKLLVDQQIQTQAEVVKACYFNSLADELSDQNSELVQFQSEKNWLDHQNKNYGHFVQNIDEDLDLRLDLSGKHHNHQALTDRQADKQFYAKETLSERGIFAAARVQTSFDDGQSVTISNTPSKYLQTMGELTSELAEAYQKINDLTARVGQLQGQKSKVERKLREHQKQQIVNVRQKKGFGYFSSFFKK